MREVPVERVFAVKLLRSKVGSTALLMSTDFQIPHHGKLSMGEAQIEFVKQGGRKVSFFRQLCGKVPSSGDLKICFIAVTADEIGEEF